MSILGTRWRRATDLVYSGLMYNTRRTYSVAQQQYFKFCMACQLDSTPATDHTLLLYVAYLGDKKLKYSSIKVYLDAVRSLHVESGL